MLLSTVLFALSSAVAVSAFTNGSLVPSYMCDPTPDGLPKNYGEVLSYTRKAVRKLAFNPTRMYLFSLSKPLCSLSKCFYPSSDILFQTPYV